MKAVPVSGLLAESLQGETHYSVDVDLEVDGTGKVVSVSLSLLRGPRPWPPTGDYRLIYFYAGEQRVEQVSVSARTWQQAVFGAI
jgi:hypothetical protein